MLILGVILLIVGFVLGIQILWIIGLIVAAIGLCLLAAGGANRTVGGRRYWY
jgi:hypothetical protein